MSSTSLTSTDLHELAWASRLAVLIGAVSIIAHHHDPEAERQPVHDRRDLRISILVDVIVESIATLSGGTENRDLAVPFALSVIAGVVDS